MTELEKGYVAALIDGEGTITLLRQHKNDKFRAPVIEITSTTYDMLQKMKDLIGGSISKITKKQEHHKQAYKWSITYNKVLVLLEEVKDYLSEPKKKARAELLLNEYKEVTPRNGHYTEEKLIRKLNFEKKFFEIE